MTINGKITGEGPIHRNITGGGPRGGIRRREAALGLNRKCSADVKKRVVAVWFVCVCMCVSGTTKGNNQRRHQIVIS